MSRSGEGRPEAEGRPAGPEAGGAGPSDPSHRARLLVTLKVTGPLKDVEVSSLDPGRFRGRASVARLPRLHCCSYGDHPGQSWSTGYTSYDGIASHYERIRQLNPAITGRGYNDAVSGTKMAAAPTQAVKAVNQGGPLCDHLVGRQRSVHLLTGDHDLDDDVPVAVSTGDGHPDGPGPQAVCVRQQHPHLYQLWQVLHTNSLARWAWANFHICQSCLPPPTPRANASRCWPASRPSTRSWPTSAPSTAAAAGTTRRSITISSAPVRSAPCTSSIPASAARPPWP